MPHGEGGDAGIDVTEAAAHRLLQLPIPLEGEQAVGPDALAEGKGRVIPKNVGFFSVAIGSPGPPSVDDWGPVRSDLGMDSQ